MGVVRTIGTIILIGSTILFGYGVKEGSDAAMTAGGTGIGVGSGLVINDDEEKSRKEEELERKVEGLQTENGNLKDENLALQIDLAHLQTKVDDFDDQRKMEIGYLETISNLRAENMVLETRMEMKSLPSKTRDPYNPNVVQPEMQTEKEESKDEDE